MAQPGPSSTPIPPPRADEEAHTYPPRPRPEHSQEGPTAPGPGQDPYAILHEPLPATQRLLPEATVKAPPSRPAGPFPPLGDENGVAPPPQRTLQFGLTPYDHDREDRRTLLQEREANDRQARQGTKRDNRQIFQERASDQRNEQNIHAANRRAGADIAATDARNRANIDAENQRNRDNIDAADRRNRDNIDARDRLNRRDNKVRLGLGAMASVTTLTTGGLVLRSNQIRADGARDAARISAGQAVDPLARNHPRDFGAPPGVKLNHIPQQVAPGTKPVLPAPKRLRAGVGAQKPSQKGSINDLD
ncbi:hypothetical protein CLCR_00314 [Cladophialophora carrionii]|uniref:Uncharacterized protein n=1 Tax=Cladophialophora carrionii TaxID=86049 RepID=A0A1C1D0U2_9EURO|nr:hypothetical protein CLCR_00314 [Cladophialophora carrionii]